MMEWQPIETGPTDGTPLLLFGSDEVVRIGGLYDRSCMNLPPAAYTDFDIDGYCARITWPDVVTATHWMHLPKPPEPAQQDYIEAVCKIGKGAECCRYLVPGRRGFECAKLTPLSVTLDVRVENNQMKARGDNCEGREGVIG